MNCGFDERVVNKNIVEKYMNSRGHALKTGNRGVVLVGFQEFCRAWLDFGGESDGTTFSELNRGDTGEVDGWNECKYYYWGG